jgi:predicted chitinase
MKINEVIVESAVDEGWKDWAATGALAAGMAMGAPAADAKPVKHHAKPAAVQKAPALSPQVANKVAAIKADVKKPSNIETTGVSMNTGAEHVVAKVAMQSGIRGTELAQFMAQTNHESADFSRMKEIGGAKYFHKRYDPKVAPKTAKILGNTHAGDGVKYHGRGYIQITGRDNYRMAGEALGLPLEQHPELAATPEVAAKIAVWYWKTRVKPNVTNFNDTQAVTKYINPALRGLKDRLENFKEYKTAMNLA